MINRLAKIIFAFIATVYTSLASAEEPTLIFLMVDGSRADYIEHYVKTGQLPNINKYFYQEGTVMQNAYTTLSLTIPSWSSVVTGVDIDRTGMIGNEVFDRETLQLENYLDWRRDLFYRENAEHGRAYRWMHKKDVNTITDYFDSSKASRIDGVKVQNTSTDSDLHTSFYPLNNEFPESMLLSGANNFLQLDIAQLTTWHNALFRLAFDNRPFTALDRDAVEQGLEVINSKNGRLKKYIGIYLPGVDHIFHSSHSHGVRSLIETDFQIGRVMKAIQRGRYKNSLVVLVGDHGSLGGKEYEIDNFHNPLRGMEYGLTGTNLSNFFTGSYNLPDLNLNDYQMNTTSAFASEGDFSLRNTVEFQIQPFQCTNVGIRKQGEGVNTCMFYHKSSPEKVHVGLTSSQMVFLPYDQFESRNWQRKNNWYTLTNYGVGRDKTGRLIRRNIIKDLEDLRLSALTLTSGSYSEYMSNLHKVGKEPLDWVALKIDKNDFNNSQNSKNLSSMFDVILINKSASSQALVLSRENLSGELEYKYVPIKNFRQNLKGEVSFDLNVVSDPLGYLGNQFIDSSKTIAHLAQFRNQREHLKFFVNTPYPTAIAAITKSMNARKGSESLNKQYGADMLLGPRYGHIFSSSDDTFNANHGMMQKEAVRITFMMNGSGVKKGYLHRAPVLSIDVLPTALKALEVSKRASGDTSVNSWVENIGHTPNFDGQPVVEVLD